MEIINFLSGNYIEIFAIVGTILTASNMIAKLTPTQKDDKIIEKIRLFFEKLSNLFLPDVKKK